MIFFDASAVVKAYVEEQGSPTVRAAVDRLRGRMYLSPLVVVEALGVLAKRRRTGVLTRGSYVALRGRFLSEVRTSFGIVNLVEDTFGEAGRLVNQHHSISVGASDFVHVASALQLQNDTRRRRVTLASSDRGLLSVARSEGLNTFDPEIEPLAALLASR